MALDKVLACVEEALSMKDYIIEDLRREVAALNKEVRFLEELLGQKGEDEE